MVKLISRVGRSSSQYLLIATMTSLLVACGGGGSGDATAEPFPDLDSDNDGTINSEDDDDDGDLILDVDDLFTDRDGDGFDDTLGHPFPDLDSDGDLTINSEDDDDDGDLILDIEDNFVDRDGDGFDDISGLTELEANPLPPVPGDGDGDGFVDVTDTTPCGSESGDDNASTNNAWNDNCLVERSSVGGQFADSLYSVGIQRVLYCEGFGTGASYTDFADGEFGPGSESALQEFQRREILTDDGKVGPQTWARLQEQLERLDQGVFDSTGSARDTYGFSEGRCAGIPMFYQQIRLAEDGLSSDSLGWSLARNQPNQTETLPFSIGSPFIDL